MFTSSAKGRAAGAIGTEIGARFRARGDIGLQLMQPLNGGA